MFHRVDFWTVVWNPREEKLPARLVPRLTLFPTLCNL
jgi:hypothetical protein